MSHFLLVFDRPNSRLLSEVPYDNHREALVARFKTERMHRDNPDVEVVVLSAESREDLRRTHSRYFQSASALASPTSRQQPAAAARKARHTA